MLVKRSFSLQGHRTSVALEPEFWSALAAMAEATGRTLARLVADTDAVRAPADPLASRLRVLALLHGQAGHERESGPDGP